jgi:hypothetical protein
VTWVYLDDKFHSNAKVLEVGNDGAGLYARALSYCGDHLTDGFVPLAWAKTAAPPKLRKKLVDHSMWIEVKAEDWYEVMDGDTPYKVAIPTAGYFIPDYLMTNPSKARVLDKRSKRQAAGRLGAAAKHGKPVADAIANALANATGDAMANGWQVADESHAPPTPTPPLSLSTPLTPLPGGEGSDESVRGSALDRLLVMFDSEGRQKIHRTIKAHRTSDYAIEQALGKARGRGARDPLAVALDALATKKRRAA